MFIAQLSDAHPHQLAVERQRAFGIASLDLHDGQVGHRRQRVLVPLAQGEAALLKHGLEGIARLLKLAGPGADDAQVVQHRQGQRVTFAQIATGPFVHAPLHGLGARPVTQGGDGTGESGLQQDARPRLGGTGRRGRQRFFRQLPGLAALAQLEQCLDLVHARL